VCTEKGQYLEGGRKSSNGRNVQFVISKCVFIYVPPLCLQSIDDKFPMQMVEEPTRRGTLLDLVLTNKEGLVEDVKVGGRLSCSDYEMVEFRILCGGGRPISSIEVLDI